MYTTGTNCGLKPDKFSGLKVHSQNGRKSERGLQTSKKLDRGSIFELLCLLRILMTIIALFVYCSRATFSVAFHLMTGQ